MTRHNKHKNTNSLSHNGKMTLYEDRVEPNATTSLSYSDNNSYDHFASTPLILRSYASTQASSNNSSSRQHHKSIERDNQSCSTDLPNINTKNMKLPLDYIHRLVEQHENRHEEQEHNKRIGQEWQLLGRIVDRLFVFLFLITTIIVFLLIFVQAPHLRLK